MVDFADIAIIGGGPAGSAAAIMLRKRHPNLSIVMLEKTQYDNWRIGETLHPDAGKAFRELGIWESFQLLKPLESPGTAAVWESPDLHFNEFRHHPEGKGWHLDRVRFDEWMAHEAAKQGTHLQKGTRYLKHKQLSPEKTRLHCQRNGQEYLIDTNFVLDASGRSAVFSPHGNRNKQVFDRLSAAICLYSAPKPKIGEQAYTLVEAVQSGWWYSALLPNQLMILAYMTDADLLKQEGLLEQSNFDLLLEHTIQTKERIQACTSSKQIHIQSAASVFRESVYGNRWLAIGDASSTFDPLSSHGIYKAIRSGIFGAYAVSDYLNGKAHSFDKYHRFIQEEYREYLSKWKHYYGIVKRWPESIFWKRRQ